MTVVAVGGDVFAGGEEPAGEPAIEKYSRLSTISSSSTMVDLQHHAELTLLAWDSPHWVFRSEIGIVGTKLEVLTSLGTLVLIEQAWQNLKTVFVASIFTLFQLRF